MRELLREVYAKSLLKDQPCYYGGHRSVEYNANPFIPSWCNQKAEKDDHQNKSSGRKPKQGKYQAKNK